MITPERRAWKEMKRRCSNPSCKDYPNYGGRGISVCPQWDESFGAFYEDMGERPSPYHSIDRKDNDGNYEPGNCRWATRKEQQVNRRPRGAKVNLTSDQVAQIQRDWIANIGHQPDGGNFLRLFIVIARCVSEADLDAVLAGRRLLTLDNHIPRRAAA